MKLAVNEARGQPFIIIIIIIKFFNVA